MEVFYHNPSDFPTYFYTHTRLHIPHTKMGVSESHNWEFWTGGGPNHWQPIRGPAVNLGKWDHLAGTYSDGKMMFYVNGELEGEKDTVIHVNSAQEFLIGAGANETANHNYFFKGIIDEVRLYSRVLDEDEIAAVMDSESLAVEASGKIAVTWGKLKAK